MCPADEASLAVTTSELCMSAHELARRTTTEFNPTQAEIDQAVTLVEIGSKPLEAFLSHFPPAGPWEGPLVQIAGAATDPAVAAAWRSGVVHTGNEAVDAVISGAKISSVQWAEDRFVQLRSNHALAAGNIVRALEGVPGIALSFDDRRATRNPYDLADEGIDPISGEHRLLFTIGWQECDVQCEQQYFWRTGILDGSARLVEEWGDPVPTDVRATWYLP